MISAEPPVRARRPLGQYSNNTPRTLFGKTSNRSGSASQSPGPACAPMRGGRQPCASAAELSTTMVFAHHRRSSEAQSPCLKCKPAAIRVPRGSARVLYCAVARTLHTMIMRELSQKRLVYLLRYRAVILSPSRILWMCCGGTPCGAGRHEPSARRRLGVFVA